MFFMERADRVGVIIKKTVKVQLTAEIAESAEIFR